MNALDTHNARILIVEDDSSYLLERILSRLQKHGYTAPDTAHNEEQARNRYLRMKKWF